MSAQIVLDFAGNNSPEEQARAAAAMQAAEEHANREWTAAVKHAIWTTARELPRFTVDDVWERFHRINGHGAQTHILDAIGPLMRTVGKEGACHVSRYNGVKEMCPSSRKGSHNNPLTVWLSDVFAK